MYSHIFLNNLAEVSAYTSTQQGGEKSRIPHRDRIEHSQRLISALNTIWAQAQIRTSQRTAISLPNKYGTYLEFKSQAGYDLITKSLEDVRQGVRLLNIRQLGEDENRETLATVYVPAGKENFFLRKLEQYATQQTERSGNPKNQKLVNSIEDIRLAILDSLWTDPLDLMPQENPTWCETWLYINSDSEIITVLSILHDYQIPYKENYISFPERAVILIYADRIQLSELIERIDFLAEFRIGQETASFWVNESNRDQLQWAQDLLNRLSIQESDVRVCILDTGINNAHQLLNPLLGDSECLTVNPNWGTNDHYRAGGHGTLMGGLAIYGKLEDLLDSNSNIEVTHKLCSVKILPPPTHAPTPVELWGEVTNQGISRAEIQLPDDRIVFCMAVTSNTDVDRGRPSSWSGNIDKLAYENGKRLIIVSAGNIIDETDWNAYPHSNLTKSVQNPAQAWNALTIGAFTEKVLLSDPAFSGYAPLAPHGGLSPFSSTSFAWEKNKWPIKPDVVFEGGNILKAPDGQLTDRHEDYALLSTSKNVLTRQFDIINATSAASAQASWMAAKIMKRYPNAWPETIRGLMVHSAAWTDQMLSQFNINLSSKADIKQLIRICGYGIPNLQQSLFTTESSLTFVAQENIQPFTKRDSRYVTNDMHFFRLPWPREELLAMGDTPVELRITLSYFIEPGAGEIGWKDKYRYQSYGLRFDLNNITETEATFKSRINAAAREEDEDFHSESGSDRWLIGSRGRSLGSIHSDIWKDSAANIASCNLLGIYPVLGWWRQRTNLRKWDSVTRYSLIVSLKTPATNVDLYTPVINLIQPPITITTQRS